MTKLYWTAIWDCWRCKFASLLLVSTVLRSWLFQYYSLKEKISDQIILDPARKRHHCSVMNHNLWFSPASLFRYDSLNKKKSQIKLILIRPDNSIILIPKPQQNPNQIILNPARQQRHQNNNFFRATKRSTIGVIWQIKLFRSIFL